MAKKRKLNGGGRMPLYRSYVFKDKDPAIDVLRTLVEQHYGHRVTGSDLSNIMEEGGPHQSTMRAWFFGKTKRPTNPTIEAAGRAMGYERVWKRMRDNK
jgi:hypothetical protein